jgi:hypothetical protein
MAGHFIIFYTVPPAIDVDSHEKNKEDHEEGTSEEAEDDPPAAVVPIGDWKVLEEG